MNRTGVTLVESLIAMGVTVMLVAVFVPLIQTSQEKVRRAACASNLRQIATAWDGHEDAMGFFPSSGWGWRYTGDPDLGFGASQPGGWLFDVIAFTDSAHVRSMGSGLEQPARDVARLAAHGTPISFINCPARRQPQRFPIASRATIGDNLSTCESGSCSVTRHRLSSQCWKYR